MSKVIPVETVLERLKDKATWLDVSTYVGWKKKARFVDPEYGEWFTQPKYVAAGHEHPKRGHIKRGKALRLSLEHILESLGDRKDWLDQTTFVSGQDKATFNHPEFGKWITNISTVIKGHDHPKVGKRNAVALNIKKYGRAVNGIKEVVDLAGQRFGKLIVISLIQKNPVKWACKCDCGTDKTYSTIGIKKSTSCGCGRKETQRKKSIEFNTTFIGKQYSKWTVVGITNRPTYLQCLCECGTIREVYRNSLMDGVSTNCGCTTPIYRTEEECRTIIEELSGQKWPKKRLFKNPETNGHLELDGYCEALSMAFEYDGEQHFKESAFGSGDDTLKERQHRDAIKDQLCAQNGIKLIRIPYIMKSSLRSFIGESLQKAIEE